MMKSEFEALIKKEVSQETFEIYQDMYLATGEKIDKVKFASMLNIDTIPEDPQATERKNKKNSFIQDIKQKIEHKKALLKRYKEFYPYQTTIIKALKKEIKELQFIL